MPRIDPSQLLQTLSVLLAPNGGIKSAGEVPRIVQLMQKFSKKLVSKCIYIHILCASTPELLELFLTQKGWDLLNAWFSDAYSSQNYYLCTDLVKLFAVCPMTSARLKENVEINQAPKLIRLLSTDENISMDVRNAALQVLQKWMSVIRSPQMNGNGTAQKTVKSGTKRPLSNKYSEDHFVTGEDSGSENDAYDAKLDFDNSKDYNPNEDSDGGSDKVKRKKLKRENSTDVDDLLDGSTETSEEEEEDEEDALTKFYKQRSEKKQKEEERRKDKERKKIEEKKSKSYSKTEMRDKLESSVKEKIKETAKKMKEEVEAKSAPSIISSLGRIPKISKADPEKKNSGPSFGDMMGGLDTVKPKPKAAPIKNKNKDLLEAFTDLSPIKPKSKSDSKSSSSDKSRSDKDKERSKDKDREKDRSEKDKERSKDKDRHRSKDKHRDKDRDRDKERRREKDKDKNKDKDSKRERRDSFSKNSDSSKSEDSERPKPKLSIPEKRSHKESSLPSPQDEKKSPKVIKESNFLGDILGDIMKEPPKKKKRRPSDVKITENNLKDLAEKAKAAEETKEKESSPESEKENTPDNESVQNSNEMEFSEPTSDLPREVRGILVYVKGNKAKKKIQWKEERELVSVEYFEVDETERVNVWKVKTFEEARKKEAMFEKSKLSTGYNEKDEDTEDNKQWKLLPIVFEGDALEAADRLKDTYGRESKEKKVQEERELRVLRALQFNQAPKDPSEPDPGTNDKLGTSVTDIPLEDLSDNKADSFYDHSLIGWPRSSSSFPGVAQDSGLGPAPGANIPTNINALLSNISTMLPTMSSMLPGPGPAPDLSKPPPGVMSSKEEEEVLAAQMAAAAQLGLGPPAPNFGPGNGHNYNNGGNGYHRGHRGGQRGHYNNDRGYNKSYSNQYNRDRYGGRDGGYNNRRPCKFWMEKGHCKEEDRCLYPHPSR